MTRWLSRMVLVTSLAAPVLAAPPATSAAAAKPSREEASVLATMDRYMLAISAKDLERMAAMQTPEGMTYRARATGDGTMDVVARPNSYWVDPSNKDARTARERYWSPTVLIRGDIAVVWAPYEYWIDGKTSHCGIDVFNFVRVGGSWRVANSMWTVEPNACAELRPKDASTIRPRD